MVSKVSSDSLTTSLVSWAVALSVLVFLLVMALVKFADVGPFAKMN